MFEDVWKPPLIFWLCMTVWLYDAVCIGSSSVGIVLSCCITRFPGPFCPGIKAIQGGASGDMYGEVKEANQLAEMDTAKSHNMKNDEVAN